MAESLKQRKKQARKIERGRCPDCGGRMLAGPTGGLSVNTYCDSCDAAFNYMGPFGAQRITGSESVRQRVRNRRHPVSEEIGDPKQHLWNQSGVDPQMDELIYALCWGAVLSLLILVALVLEGFFE